MRVENIAREKRRRRSTSFLATLLLLSGVASGATAPAEPVSPSRAAAIERGQALLQALVDASGSPGLSVAVAVQGKIVWAEGFGYADLENRLPVTPLTKFRIGSVSKPLTSMALGLLYEQGKLDLDAPIQSYVPYFPEKRWPISVRQLAGHLGGIRSYDYASYDDEKNEFLSDERYETVRDALTIFQDDPLVHEPGTRYLYTSNGWNLISAAVEGASDEDFLNYMQKSVFEPIGLLDTVADRADTIIPHRTRFYNRNEDGLLVNAPYADLSNKWAGGGFLSTPSDLVRWGSALLAEEPFLKPETLALFWKSQRTSDGEETEYGFGWRVDRDGDGRRRVAHGGGSVGGTTYFVIYPDDRVVIAMNVNASISPMSVSTSQTIAEGFLTRLSTESSTGEPGLAGSYRYSVSGDGIDEAGTLHIAGVGASVSGWIHPDHTPTGLRQTQDGSYSMPLPARIPIVHFTVNGRNVRIIGADPSGFINLWLIVDDDRFEGRWDGRRVVGELKGGRVSHSN